MTDNTHCQICARLIKASKGVIAHHGYKRPGYGYQTGSCYGARFRPYEVAKDAIEKMIVSVTNDIASMTKLIADMLINPPAELSFEEVEYKTGRTKYYPLPRPADFDPKADVRLYIRKTYAYQHKVLLQKREAYLRQAKEFLQYLNERLAAWKPAANRG